MLCGLRTVTARSGWGRRLWSEAVARFSAPTGCRPRPTKSTDSRSCRFRGGSVEVDAIPAPVLRGLVEAPIERHVDPDALRLTRMAEDNERRVLLAMRGSAGL